MSEFQDFLKHNYAYVAIGEFKPGQFEKAEQLYEKAVSNYGEGFKGSYLLQEPGTDKGIAIIFWESPGDMEANQTEASEAIIHEINPLFAKPPVTGLYEVVSKISAKKED
ncbi:antibiotic biosynthesis monooxygenase [Ancylothrix sp. C2]|uniref:antibiotic biosynthesis monooxygenase n=1 Tax=Ancylothrix sp. D3o TaxID=2953691 RepID=UPI0021BB93FF|nr:antibiotic biosynthesis monooxygenase [Ancylothrix sp. D3o]MCT7948413.1 antibiotic biosynthesis monooxygenase [Ancylothrix sp. D3o]